MARCCRTCRWFEAVGEGRTGECGHPELEAKTGMRLVVRSKELHCRMGWGDDRWDVVHDDVVLDIRVREPDGASADRGLTTLDMPRDARRSDIQSAEAVISAWGALPAPETAAER